MQDNQPQLSMPVYTANPNYGFSQPGLSPFHSAPATPWSTGLCGSSDIGLWCITCWFPFITFGRIAEIVDRGSSTCMSAAIMYMLISHCTGFPWIYSASYRTKIRQQYRLEASPCNDYCLHCCCHNCSLRQEYRELKLRGFDPALGWQGNMNKYINEVQMATSAPALEAGMRR